MFKFIHIVAEDRINAALKKGELDDLPGKGKPLAPDEAANMPEELRMAYRILRNSGHLCPEAEEKARQGTEISTAEMLPERSGEHEAYRRMRRLEVLARRAGKNTELGTDSPYYERLIENLRKP